MAHVAVGTLLPTPLSPTSKSSRMAHALLSPKHQLECLAPSPARSLFHLHRQPSPACKALPFGPTGGTPAGTPGGSSPRRASRSSPAQEAPTDLSDLGRPHVWASPTHTARRRLDLAAHAAATAASAAPPATNPASPGGGLAARPSAECDTSRTSSAGGAAGGPQAAHRTAADSGEAGAASLLGREEGGAGLGAGLELRELPQLLAALTLRGGAAGASGGGEAGPLCSASELAGASSGAQRVALLGRVHAALAGGSVRAGQLLAVPGLVAFLVDHLAPPHHHSHHNHRPPAPQPGPGAAAAAGAGSAAGARGGEGQVVATCMALECLCTLLTEDASAHVSSLLPAIARTLAVLHATRLTWPASIPPPALLGRAHTSASAASAPGWAWPPDATAEGAGWSPEVSAAFFAASLLVRCARYPALAAATVEGGGLALLVRLMSCRPPMLAQMAVFATYKLVRPAAGGGGGAAVSPGGGGEEGGGGGEAAGRGGALVAVAAAGGMGALCRCLESLDDRPSRDMASSLMLDMALAPQVPGVVARLGHVRPLVCVLASRASDATVRMYALLILARLCNHSPECQMDAVREGAIEPLLSMVRRGGEEEATHACRLLAILAQALPTHGRFKELQVVSAVLPLLRAGERGPERGQVVAEHAASVLAVLAQNPDMHFNIVGAGSAPLLVALLGKGTDKTRTYVLATLMLLCDHEQRHAAVVVRAGAVPALVAAVRAGLAAAAPPSAASAAAAGQRGVAVTEFAAAVLCSLSRYVEVQAELVSHGVVGVLLACLGAGTPEAAAHAAEALVHTAAGDGGAKRAIAADGAAVDAALRLMTGGGSGAAPPGVGGAAQAAAAAAAAGGDDAGGAAARPNARYWAMQLLRVLSTDDEALAAALHLPPGGLRPGEALEEDEGEGSVVAAVPAPAPAHPLLVPRAAQVVFALVAQLRWREEPASWQQGRCRVLAAWLLCRFASLPPLAPLVLLSGAPRALLRLLAEQQAQRAAAAAAAAAAALSSGDEGEGLADLPVPLLPEEGGGLLGGGGSGSAGRGSPSGSSDGGAADYETAAPDALFSGGGGGSRSARFDSDAGAAARAALLAVARLGRAGRTAVMSELALLQWMGVCVRLEGLDDVVGGRGGGGLQGRS